MEGQTSQQTRFYVSSRLVHSAMVILLISYITKQTNKAKQNSEQNNTFRQIDNSLFFDIIVEHFIS